jgi:hypothetical protein
MEISGCDSTARRKDVSCLLLSHADTNNNSSSSNNNNNNQRILLQGPSQSGRTSLAMNLAYACAAATTTTTASAIHGCHCLLQPCCCTNVVFYRLRKAKPPNPDSFQDNNDYNNEDFPIRCRYIGVVVDDNDDDENENPTKSGATNTNTTTTFSDAFGIGPTVTTAAADVDREVHENNCGWDPTILGRIRIQYVTGSKDLLQDLLEMMGKPLREHPTHAIVVDDLDLICGGGSAIGGGASSTAGSTAGSTTSTNQSVSSTMGRLGEANSNYYPYRPQQDFAEMTTRMMQLGR